MNEFCWKLLFHSFEWTSSAFFIVPPINKLCFRPVGWNQGLTCRALTVLLTLPPPLHSSPAITLSHSLYISLFIIDANTRTHITLSDLRTVTHPLCLSYTKSQSQSYSPTRTLSFSLSLSNSPSLAQSHTHTFSFSVFNAHSHTLSLAPRGLILPYRRARWFPLHRRSGVCVTPARLCIAFAPPRNFFSSQKKFFSFCLRMQLWSWHYSRSSEACTVLTAYGFLRWVPWGSASSAPLWSFVSTARNRILRTTTTTAATFLSFSSVLFSFQGWCWRSHLRLSRPCVKKSDDRENFQVRTIQH